MSEQKQPSSDGGPSLFIRLEWIPGQIKDCRAVINAGIVAGELIERGSMSLNFDLPPCPHCGGVTRLDTPYLMCDQCKMAVGGLNLERLT